MFVAITKTKDFWKCCAVAETETILNNLLKTACCNPEDFQIYECLPPGTTQYQSRSAYRYFVYRDKSRKILPDAVKVAKLLGVTPSYVRGKFSKSAPTKNDHQTIKIHGATIVKIKTRPEKQNVIS